MFDISLFFLLQNITFLTIFFWILNFLGEKFFKKKNHKNSKDFFECGFFSIGSLNLTINLNFFLIAALLVLYDVEFFFLLPFIFNWSLVCNQSLIIFIIFLVFVLLSFLFDWEFVSLDWSL